MDKAAWWRKMGRGLVSGLFGLYMVGGWGYSCYRGAPSDSLSFALLTAGWPYFVIREHRASVEAAAVSAYIKQTNALFDREKEARKAAFLQGEISALDKLGATVEARRARTAALIGIRDKARAWADSLHKITPPSSLVRYHALLCQSANHAEMRYSYLAALIESGQMEDLESAAREDRYETAAEKEAEQVLKEAGLK